MHREEAEFYSIEDIACLLQTAAATFDYCLIETNAYWDNAATIGVMMRAGMRLLVTRPQLGDFQEDVGRWLHTLAPVFGLTSQSFDLLITQKEGRTSVGSYSSRDMKKETAMNRVGEIRKSIEIDAMLNQGNIWEAVVSNHMLGKDLSHLARTVLTLFGETPLEIVEEKSWIQQRFEWFKHQERRISFARK